MKSFSKPARDPRATLVFIALAVFLMVVVHLITDGRLVAPKLDAGVMNVVVDEAVDLSDALDAVYYARPASYKLNTQDNKDLGADGDLALMNDRDFDGLMDAYAPEPDAFGPYLPDVSEIVMLDEDKNPEIEKSVTKPAAKKVAKAYEPLRVSGKPKIAIIIDDMGVDRKRSFETIEIDAPLTLAFLPYASELSGITQDAKDGGHELMIHMPMQPVKSKIDLGPIALRDGMEEQEVKDNVRAAFDSFEGYEGLNNHMGSLVTQNPEIMDWVMEVLDEKGLYFIDSKTINTSVADDAARAQGLPRAVRDVFLDHKETPEFVSNALRKTEVVAAKKGYAIAIGHPKDVTLEGLRAWLPDVQARGFEIVHASALIEYPVQKTQLVKNDSNADGEENLLSSERLLADVLPASGVGAIEVAVQAPQRADPNSAKARESILKRLLGQ